MQYCLFLLNFADTNITYKIKAELMCVSEQQRCLVSEWIQVLNESNEWMTH